MIKIIAEAGVNHNGNAELAFKLVDAAFSAGADIVKFQTFNASSLVTSSAKQADYQIKNTGIIESQLVMLKRLELPKQTYLDLQTYCNGLGIEFLSTAFDSESLKFLVEDLKLKTLKIPSGDITNTPFILEHALTGCDVILSTGMATLGEIEEALGALAFGYIGSSGIEPSSSAFAAAYISEIGQRLLTEKVTILHCTTEYPAPIKEINLNAMTTLSNTFRLSTGYSDHSAGILVPIAAAALGAKVIEKHFTLDKNLDGPDHKASLDLAELTEMVTSIRTVEVALGSAVKAPQKLEITNKSVARKSLVTAKKILSGQLINKDDVLIKRPGNGLSPSLLWDLIGSKASRDYEPDELYDFSEIK